MCEHANAMADNCCVGGGRSSHYPSGAHCHCSPHVPRGFLTPGIMLLLAEEPSHGYTLLAKLTTMGVVGVGADLSVVYRVLRQLEEDALAVSDFVDEGKGPARKVYRLTGEGWEILSAWSAQMKGVGRLIEDFQRRYDALEKGI